MTTRLVILQSSYVWLWVGTVLTIFQGLLIHERLGRHSSSPSRFAKFSRTSLHQTQSKDHMLLDPARISSVQNDIRAFFHHEERALSDGTWLSNSRHLQERVQQKRRQCVDGATCSSLRIVYVGGAQMSGRDSLFNQTFPFVVQKYLSDLGRLEIQVLNHAMDHDANREGPQTSHLCVQNFAHQADIVVWGYDDSMQASRRSQFELFVRVTLQTIRPALIVVHRQGPHGIARRGVKQHVVEISPYHQGIVYNDDESVEPHTTPYRESDRYQQRWNHSNAFWWKIFEHYDDMVDFGTVDPAGGIWHLDHKREFSNRAFDEGKVLPLVDCDYPGHPPPCNRVPMFIQRHLERENKTVEDLPDDTGGGVCSGYYGCRHSWYGGAKSHHLRGALSAFLLLRALQDVAGSKNTEPAKNEQRSLRTELPPPLFCPSNLCDKTPQCLHSYVPNMLTPIVNYTNPLPRMGVAHNLNRLERQYEDLNKRVVALGYKDRKYGFRLAHGGKDIGGTTISFSGGGPLILCEPPCWNDECPKKRFMPMMDHVTVRLNGVQVKQSAKKPPEVGKHCFLMDHSFEKGNHTLEIETTLKDPDFVMLSHVISFT